MDTGGGGQTHSHRLSGPGTACMKITNAHTRKRLATRPSENPAVHTGLETCAHTWIQSDAGDSWKDTRELDSHMRPAHWLTPLRQRSGATVIGAAATEPF